jgi:ornithine decarboxylase
MHATAAPPQIAPRPVGLLRSTTHGDDILETPYLALDSRYAVRRLAEMSAALEGTAIHYAVKANPHPHMLAALARAGSRFDVASPEEVTLCLAAGARADDLVYSNPVKRRTDLAVAYALGVRLYVVDSASELDKVAQVAPRSSVLCRLLTSGEGSDWPLSRKFGAPAAECLDLLAAARTLGLDPAGIAFHVGSQQRDPRAWDDPIRQSAGIFRELRDSGIEPWLLDLGGGFPAAGLEGATPRLESYGLAVADSLSRHFGARRPRTVAEPGRAIVGDAGVLVSSVLSVCWRGGRRWVYLDAGVFTGLVETLDEAIRYRIEADVAGGPGVPTGPAVLAGPTCDSADVMYERTPVQLPMSLAEGDVVRLRAAGAYTTCYSTVGFNGYAPLRTELVDVLP